jgi:hypothetical protein
MRIAKVTKFDARREDPKSGGVERHACNAWAKA